MHEAAADDDLQLYLFPTNEYGLPNHQQSFGDFGGRYSGLIAWNKNSRGFFLYHRILRGQTGSMRDKFSYYHIVTRGDMLSSTDESYLGRNGSRYVGALIDANPWLNDAAQQPLDGGSAPWRDQGMGFKGQRCAGECGSQSIQCCAEKRMFVA